MNLLRSLHIKVGACFSQQLRLEIGRVSRLYTLWTRGCSQLSGALYFQLLFPPLILGIAGYTTTLCHVPEN